MTVSELLRLAVEKGASDLHLCAESPPAIRVHGRLERLPGPALTPSRCRDLLYALLGPEQQSRFERNGEIDFAYSAEGTGRFRVNGYLQRGTVALAVRVIPSHVPSLDELGLPPVVADLARRRDGLVLVTGPTGSGKSTTLAAMIDLINREDPCHVITLEDPIEYVHQHRRAIINQREVGSDTPSFAHALRAALRQDPDVILVGEMRDLETISIALTAAETGHLVLATLHTPDASQAVDRVLGVFPAAKEEEARTRLAASLQGVIAQRLLPRRDRGGRVAALEVLVATPAVRNLIRDARTYQLYSAMQTGARWGMRTMESSLRELADKGIIEERYLAEFRQEEAAHQL